MVSVRIYNLTLLKKEKSRKRTINSAFNSYGELTLSRLPVVCKLNGKWILRDDWSTKLTKKDILEFHILPQGGGGGSDVGRMVAMAAVVVAAIVLGPEAATLAGFAEGTAGFYITSGVVSAAVMTAGTLAVNTLMPLPMPKIQGINYNSNSSPTYSLQAQGNSARVGSAIPVIYGRHMIYADFGAIPYYYYENNEQYLNQLFVIGMGEYDIEKIRIEDTDIANFKEIEYEIIQPNQPITLFNHNCVQATEVSSQTLSHDSYQGGFTLNKPNSIINAIGIDIIFPRGLYALDNNGNLQNANVTLVVEARQIDDEGQPIDDWQEIINQTFTNKKNSPVRETINVDIANGRYEVRAKRTTAESTSTKLSDQIVWAGLKGFLVDEVKYPGITLVAMKMKATDNLSSTTSRKVNFIVTRKLPIWNAETGWSEPVKTRSIAWAFADICKASYGGQLIDEEINLRQLAYLDTIYQQTNDTFNAVFDSKLTLLEALGRVGKTSRTLAFIQAGKVNFVRDFMDSEIDLEPSIVFNKENIIKDSWKLEYILPTSDSVDYAEVTYFDERTWTNQTFEYALPGSNKNKKTQMTMFGITNKSQAQREAEYHLLCNKYRRRVMTFNTEMEGGIPTIGSLIRVSFPIPKWGISGFCKSYDEASQTLEVTEPLTMEDDTEYFICLRNNLGKAEKAIKVIREPTMTEQQLKLTSTPDFEIYTDESHEKTNFIFGKAQEISIDAKVNSIKARNPYQYTITATLDDSRIYSSPSE